MMKKKAKESMLKELSKAMADDAYSPVADALKNKKMQKVTVMSDSKEGLKKGLSKAEEIMKAKSLDSIEDESEESEEESPVEDAIEDTEDMSKEELLAMMDMIKQKLEKLS